MTDWLGTFLAISARQGDRLYLAEPAWVWSRDGSSVLWCNPAGAVLLGISNIGELANIKFPEMHNLRRDVANVARSLGAGGTLALLRFYAGGRTSPTACRCERMRLEDGRTLISIIGIEAATGTEPLSDQELAAFVLAGAGSAFVVDPAGQMLAGHGQIKQVSEFSGIGEPGEAASDRLMSAQAMADGRQIPVRYIRLHSAQGPRLLLWAEPLPDDGPAAGPEVGPENGVAGLPVDAIGETAGPGTVNAFSVIAGVPDLSAPADEPRSDPGQPGSAGSDLLQTPAGLDAALSDVQQDQSLVRQANILRTALRGATSAPEELPDPNSWTEAFEHLPKKPVRFLWQTDADDRFLFVSPGLEQLVGRTSQIVGERWFEISDRLRLDPVGRIASALAERDTWSGFTAWWPTDDHTARIPAELTALPVFSIDQAFQGYRGFGVLKPAEALSAASFDRRFPGDPLIIPESVPLARTAASSVSVEPEADHSANIVPIRGDIDRLPDFARLSPQERSAFEEIASALRTHPEFAQIYSEAGPAALRPDSDDADRMITAPAEVATGEQASDANSDRDAGNPVPAGDDGDYEYSTDADDPAFLASLPDADDDYPPGIDETGSDDVGSRSAPDDPATDRVENESEPHDAAFGETVSGEAAAEPETGAGSEPDGAETLETPGAGSDTEADHAAAIDAATTADGDEPGIQQGDLVAPRPANDDQAGSSDLLQPGNPADAQRQIKELTTILDTALDGVLILDETGLVISLNDGTRALFGKGEEAISGTPFVDLLSAGSQKLALDNLEGLRSSGVAAVFNEGHEVMAPVGHDEIPLFMTMSRLDDDGRICVVLHDIRRWKRTEAELIAGRDSAELASSQKSDFLARVSHEIRTPLNAIIGFAEVMIEERFGAVENDRYREYLRDIRISGEHVVSLVNDLLDISKIEAGKLELTFSAVPINDLVRECVSLMQPQANREKVIVRSSYAADLPSIVADPRTMRQVVLNLLSNSVKFTGAGGQVIVSTTLSENGEAVLRVRDTGPGMSEQDLARALEPFRQLSTSRIGDENGTGLGLPLTKALVEANRAAFAISSARGEGTIVQVTFPATRVLSE